MRGKIRSIIIMCIITLLGGCGILEEKGDFIGDPNKDSSNETVEINLWTYFEVPEDLISGFEAENPLIKVNCKKFSYEEYEEEYKKSLIKNEGDADMFIIDSNEYGKFNSIEGLEDLLNPEYEVTKYKDDFDPELWDVGKSLYKDKLLGLPISSAPLVTYYRKDILESYGFPVEPDELAEFMKDKNNWFEMATTLKKDGISLVQWYAELVKISTANMPYFDENLEYKRDNEEFRQAVSTTIEAKKLGLAALNDIWTENGKNLLKEGKLAMLYLGSWGSRDLEAIVPEQAGNWRVTTLPFGVYGWNNASIISMAENSKNKEEAWKFIEYYTFKYKNKNAVGSIPGYIPIRGDEEIIAINDFLGGQDEHAIYHKSMEKTKEYSVTPLDADAFKIWDDALNEGIDKGLSVDEIMDNIRIRIEDKFKGTIEILKNKSEE